MKCPKCGGKTRIVDSEYLLPTLNRFNSHEEIDTKKGTSKAKNHKGTDERSFCTRFDKK